MGTGRLFTSESVTEGHPDKVCDQIADAILDDLLGQDPHSRVAVEVFAPDKSIFIGGEVTSEGWSDIKNLVPRVIREIGYNKPEYGFDATTVEVCNLIKEQSTEIATMVGDRAEINWETLGAGDQGMMFGYACTETPALMPLPIFLAHALAQQLALVRREGILPFLRPDGKTQVTIEYDHDNNPVAINNVVVSCQHDDIPLDEVRERVQHEVIRPAVMEVLGSLIIPPFKYDIDCTRMQTHINEAGSFILGGPPADSGLTGRKIIVDTYGGYCPHGGGAFSGKDPTKVDRSGHYAARWVAKNIVAAGLASRCEVQIAYVIGRSEPVSVAVRTFGTGKKFTETMLAGIIRGCFDLRPGMIIRQFDLLRPLYRKVSCYGHFGRPELELPWESLGKVQELMNI